MGMLKPATDVAEDPLAWWLQRLAEPSFVYVIRAMPGTPVKIGRALDVYHRISELQTGNPYPLQLLYVFPGSHELEWQLHQKLAGHRLTGEWFEAEPAEAMFPFFERLGAAMMAAYADDGKIPDHFAIRSEEWRMRSLPGRAITVRFVEPTPVDPEIARQRRLAAAMRPRRKGDMTSVSGNVTTVI